MAPALLSSLLRNDIFLSVSPSYKYSVVERMRSVVRRVTVSFIITTLPVFLSALSHAGEVYKHSCLYIDRGRHKGNGYEAPQSRAKRGSRIITMQTGKSWKTSGVIECEKCIRNCTQVNLNNASIFQDKVRYLRLHLDIESSYTKTKNLVLNSKLCIDF